MRWPDCHDLPGLACPAGRRTSPSDDTIAAHAAVLLRYHTHALELEILDDGCGPGPGPPRPRGPAQRARAGRDARAGHPVRRHAARRPARRPGSDRLRGPGPAPCQAGRDVTGMTRTRVLTPEHPRPAPGRSRPIRAPPNPTKAAPPPSP